jgi:hypothetical protein
MRRIIALLVGSRLVVVPLGDTHHGRDHHSLSRTETVETEEDRREQTEERKEVHRVIF